MTLPACCPDGAGASVSPCPNCDGKGATTSPPPCQCNYNLGPVVTCCCTDDNLPPAGCCVEPTTTTMRLPTTLSVTLADLSGCACVSGGFDITYDALNGWWTGSGSLGTCGQTYTVKFGCAAEVSGHCGTCTWWLDDTINPCGAVRTCWSDTSDLCGPPFTIEFHVSGPVPCGCTGMSNSFKVIITL